MRSTTKLGPAMDFARAHHDLLTTKVLTEQGFTPRQITQLCSDGIIEWIIRGLYRLSGTRTALQDVAACLLRHPVAVASHVTALFLHGLDVRPPTRPHFTMPAGWGAATRLGVAHRSPLDPVDQTRKHRLRVTTVARSIVDASEVTGREELAGIIDEAISRKMVTLSEIIDAAGRAEQAPGRRGLGRLRTVLSSWTDAIEPDSPAEAAAIRRIISFGLPAPVTQHEVHDADGVFVARLDMAWPALKVAREYVSVRWHAPDKIEQDELRLQRLEAEGWTVDNLYRYQVAAGEVQWLRDLDAELRVAAA